MTLSQSFLDLIFHLTHNPVFIRTAGLINKYVSPWWDVKVNVHGKKMFARKLDRIVALIFWKLGSTNTAERKFVKKSIKPGDVVVDIGANVGYFTLLLSSLVGPRGKVYAFEPDPENFRILKKTLNANKCSNVEPIQAAVASKNGELELYISEEHTGDHRIGKTKGRKSITVPCYALDSFFSKRKKPSFMKIDAQGAEYHIFKGMKNLLSTNLSILSEFWPEQINKTGGTAKQILAQVRKKGFAISEIDEKQNKLKKRTDEYLLRKYRKHSYTTIVLQK